MNLYLLTTVGLGVFFVLATDPTTAQNILKAELDNANYGFTKGRKVTEIKLLSEETTPLNKDTHLNFSSGNNLIISNRK